MRIPILRALLSVLVSFCCFSTSMTALSKEKLFVNSGSLWIRLQNQSKLEIPIQTLDHPLVQRYLKIFSHNGYLHQLTRKSSPYLRFILNSLHEKDLPGELALIPMIESAYHPKALSKKGATGLWQIMPLTAKTLGLQSASGGDKRLDILRSTEAALKYFRMLESRLGGNWFLATAAYNGGLGTIKKALKNKDPQTLSTLEILDLPLPKETRHYLAKVLALWILLKQSNLEDLPPLHDQPYLALVTFQKSLPLSQTTRLSGLSLQELQRFNPSLSNKTSSEILMPIANAYHLLKNISHGYMNSDASWNLL